MQPVINIYTLKINSISGNASVNIGESFHNSPTSNSKSTGANTSYGDEAPSISTMKNLYVDPDVNDQSIIKSSDQRPLKEA
jgi:hypothetical protein